MGSPAGARLLRRRHRREKRFRALGVTAIATALAILVFLLVTIGFNAYTAFGQTYLQIGVRFDAAIIDPEGTRRPETLAAADYDGLVKAALDAEFPAVTERADQRLLYRLVSGEAGQALRDAVASDPSLIGQTQPMWLKAGADVDMLNKGYVDRATPELDRRLNDRQIGWYDSLVQAGRVERRFNADFFTEADSREAEQAGILGALVGSILTLSVTLALSFPLGVMAAVYLQEFAPKRRWVDFVEVNINNLAAVPSVIFGLLGLAIFLNFFGLPRSAPLVGGLVLTLLTFPTVIIASRAALDSVPPSIREGALAMGASPLQTILHHVVPLAMPGMLTGTIIGMARALGESAPLLMIGMVAFIVDVPGGFTDASTVLPVQVFLWADAPERAFVERTSAAIVVLLAFLLAMNLAAIVLRSRFERRW